MTDEARRSQDDEVALPAHVVELLAHPGTWAAPPAFTAAELIALAEGSAPGSPADRPAARRIASVPPAVAPATGSAAAPALGATAEAASVPPA
ncbi:hypothetical protein AB0M20_41530, partial [Actinoplanes sp. NPDC051633]